MGDFMHSFANSMNPRWGVFLIVALAILLGVIVGETSNVANIVLCSLLLTLVLVWFVCYCWDKFTIKRKHRSEAYPTI